MNRFDHGRQADAFLDWGGRNLKSCHTCWEDWGGPIITDDDEDPAGWLQINQCGVYYGAPCRIISQIDDQHLEVRVQYRDDAPEHCKSDNGTICMVGPEEIWPPVQMLIARRDREEFAEAIAAGKKCECGADPVHVMYFGKRVECAACRELRIPKLK